MENTEIIQYLNDNKDNLEEAFEYIAFRLGVSVKRAKTIALELGFRQRRERADKGTTACPEEVIDIIAARVRMSIKKSATDKFDINTSIKKEYKELIKNGVDIPVGYSRICSLLKDLNLDRSSLIKITPFIRLNTPHVNHTHLFDVTNCLQWHLEHGRAMREEDLVWLYPNKVLEEAKKRDKKLKLLRYLMIDHKSRCFYFQYFYTSGENAKDGAEFFYNAWACKKPLIEKILGEVNYDGGYQFQGVPKYLYVDAGSIARDGAIKNLLARMNVNLLIHKTHNPRAKGMVERHMKIIGDNFESNLRRYKIETLEELNRYALDWCIEFNNNEIVSKTKYTRSGMWRMIKGDELQILPPKEVYTSLISKDGETRVLNGNCEFSYKGQDYICDNPNFAGQKVKIKIHLSDYPLLHLHFNGLVEVAYPFERDEFGVPKISRLGVIGEKYASHSKTDAEIMKEHIEQVAERVDGVTFTGNNDKRIAKPTLKNAKPEKITKKDEKVAFLDKKGEKVKVENPYKPISNNIITPPSQKKQEENEFLIPLSQAITMLILEYGYITPEENKKLKTLYPKGIPKELSATELYNIISKKEEEAGAEDEKMA